MLKYKVSLTEDAENDLAELVAFYEELVDAESASKFLDEAIETLENLQDLPKANSVFKNDPNIRKVQMENHKVAIIYVVDDGHYEVIAVRAYHQLQNPKDYQKSVLERLKKLS